MGRRSATRYSIVVEPTDRGISASSPHLPDRVATGRTREEAGEEMRQAIDFHVEGMCDEGYESPRPSSYSTYVELCAKTVLAVDRCRPRLMGRPIWRLRCLDG